MSLPLNTLWLASPCAVATSERTCADRSLAGTNPIHNKKPKKKPAQDLDEEDLAFKAKQQAGAYPALTPRCRLASSLPPRLTPL